MLRIKPEVVDMSEHLTFSDSVIDEFKKIASVEDFGGERNIERERNAGNTVSPDRIVDFGTFTEDQVTFSPQTSDLAWYDIEQVTPEIKDAYAEGDINKETRNALIERWRGVFELVADMGEADFQNWFNRRGVEGLRSRLGSDSGSGGVPVKLILLGLALLGGVLLLR